MARSDLSEIVLVVDRSGSMASCVHDAEGGINQFIKEQKAVPGDANFTLVQFDTEYEFVHKGVPIKDVGDFILCPRGMTALLDAVGQAISQTGERLDKLPEADKPGCVIVVIVTDGHENSSREYTLEKVREMITHQQEKYNWKFTFLGADATAFDTGKSMGINLATIARYDSSQKAGVAYATVSRSVGAARNTGLFEYTDEQRKAMT